MLQGDQVEEVVAGSDVGGDKAESSLHIRQKRRGKKRPRSNAKGQSDRFSWDDVKQMPWIKVVCFPSKGVSKKKFIEKLGVDVIDNSCVKIINKENCVFFAPRDFTVFLKVKHEKKLLIGSKLYQCSCVNDIEQEELFPVPARIRVSKRPKTFVGSEESVLQDQKRKDQVVEETLVDSETKETDSLSDVPSTEAVRMDLDLHAKLQNLEAIVYQLVDRFQASQDASHPTSAANTGIDTSRGQEAFEKSRQLSLEDCMSKHSKQYSVSSLLDLYPQNLSNIVFPKISRKLKRYLLSLCSQNKDLANLKKSLYCKSYPAPKFLPTQEVRIRIGSLNVQSFTEPKKLGVVKLMEDSMCNIMCIQETWRRGPLKTSNLYGKTYHSIGFTEVNQGRGIGILIDRYLNFRIEDTMSWAAEDLEILTISSTSGGLITNVYIPPKRISGIEKLFELVSNTPTTYPYWFIIGDLNANHESWSSGTTNSHGNGLAEFLEDHDEFVGCFPNGPTYISGNRSTTIDLALKSSKIDINPVQLYIEDPGKYGIRTPHFMIHGSLIVDSTTLLQHAISCFDAVTYSEMSSTVMSHLWKSERFSNLHVNDFIGVVQHCISACTRFRRNVDPNKLVRELFQDPKAIDIRNRILNSSDASTSDALQRQHHRTIRQIKESSFKAFLDELLWQNNTLWSFWKALRLLGNNYYLKTRDPSLGREDDIRTSWLNNFTIDPRLLQLGNYMDKPEYWTPESQSGCELDYPTAEDIEAILKRRPNPGTPGPDGITYEHLRLLGGDGFQIISRILNQIVVSGVWPVVYKQALLKALPKDDSESNFRPISLLPCLSKVHESFIAGFLKRELEERHIISDAQFGGRKNSSTDDILSHTLLDVSESLDCGQHTIILYLDISKAFDRIYHPIMLEILREYKFTGSVVDFIKSYLENRSYYIRSDGAVGKSIQPQHGGPQGSVLLPLLWILYINPLVDTAHRGGQNIKAFVDDCQWLFKFDPKDGFPEEEIYSVLETITTFCTYLRLTVSSQKCKFLYIYGSEGKPIRLPRIIAPWDNQEIQVVREYKSLGIILDSRFLFASQGKRVIKNARRRLTHLKKLVSLPTELLDRHLMAFWNNCFLSGFSYCLEWYKDFLSIGNQNKLRSLYNESLRVISFIPKGTTAEHVLAGRRVVSFDDYLMLKQLRYIRRRIKCKRSLISEDLIRWLTFKHPLLDGSEVMIRFLAHELQLNDPIDVFQEESLNVVKEAECLSRGVMVQRFQDKHLVSPSNPCCTFLKDGLLNQYRALSKWIFRFRSSSLVTPSWLARRNLIESPQCPNCPEKDCTIVHILNVCRGSGKVKLREDLNAILGALCLSLGYSSDLSTYESLVCILNEPKEDLFPQIIQAIEIAMNLTRLAPSNVKM